MPQQSEAMAADELPPQAATPEPTRSGGQAWRLVADAPESELPDQRDRGGSRTGMLIVLAVGALFWLAVAGTVIAMVLRP